MADSKERGVPSYFGVWMPTLPGVSGSPPTTDKIKSVFRRLKERWGDKVPELELGDILEVFDYDFWGPYSHEVVDYLESGESKEQKKLSLPRFTQDESEECPECTQKCTSCQKCACGCECDGERLSSALLLTYNIMKN
jgi:hypothetical protein